MDYESKWRAERERAAFLALADGTVFHGVAFTFTRIEVSAEALSALIVKRPPSRGEYYVGEAINMSGAEIVAKLKDGTERILTESDYALEYDFSEVGVATVRVSYGGLSANFAVSVSNPPAVSMSVLPPSKTVYYAGEELDLTGGALLLNFETRSNVYQIRVVPILDRAEKPLFREKPHLTFSFLCWSNPFSACSNTLKQDRTNSFTLLSRCDPFPSIPATFSYARIVIRRRKERDKKRQRSRVVFLRNSS